jgi:N-acetylmuramoyl-L-alanine amidase CwlA
LFVDDKEIIECIPALTSSPEKAWHVRYDVTSDNAKFGDDANDVAIGVEYCFGNNINATEAYTRYVWVLATLCKQFNLDPQTKIIGHYLLDPSRRTDPVSGLHASGRTYQQLLVDVAKSLQGTTPTATTMKLIKNTTSNKVYAIGADNKKHWIFNEETFTTGQAMGLWGDYNSIQTENDDAYALGNAIILIKQ